MYDNLKEKILKTAGKKTLSLEEDNFIAKWKEEYKLKDDIIHEAVKRTIKRKGKLSFYYTDAILRNWAANSVNSYMDIVKLDAEYKNKPKNQQENKEEHVEKKEEQEVDTLSLSKIKIKLIRSSSKVPSYGSEGAAGADLYADIDFNMYIPSNETMFIGTGVAMEIPPGYAGLVFARSGMACKQGLALANSVALIDSDYRGEIKVALKNFDTYDESEMTKEDFIARHTISPGERIAQIMIVPFISPGFEIVDKLSETLRGNNGFGSTGKK